MKIDTPANKIIFGIEFFILNSIKNNERKKIGVAKKTNKMVLYKNTFRQYIQIPHTDL